MSYRYADRRINIFTDEGQRSFLAARDKVNALLAAAGAVRMSEAMNATPMPATSWDMMANVDRLVELGEIREITGPEVAGQHRVFVRVEKS